jgi:hypothetical protein
MSDRLYLSCRVQGFNDSNMLRHFGKMLAQFPYSKLAQRGSVLRVYALEHVEPPVVEREFAAGADASALVAIAREFARADCCVEVDAAWDLWQFDGDWKLRPAAVTLSCFGPEFEQERDDHLRIDFGLDSRFLPNPGIEGWARMGQSNLRSLVHLVGEIEKALPLERRQLWSESGVNFAELLRETVRGSEVP